ncbi:MAG: DUF1015 domain-containing protein [Armatimonadetes bacterium]|nr:DUF1015 domain-containing protein [Armatimonadota bacterium]
MACIKPFKGIRYNPSLIPGLAEVIAPPYDVISPYYQKQLCGRHPHNVVRLILGEEHSDDDEHSNKYARAAHWFRQWLTENILAEEEAPALYVYDQTYAMPEGESRTRRGLFAALRLEPWEAGIVRPHEFTHPGPKVDRMKLFRASRANFSPIFGLYEDPGSEVERALSVVEGTAPAAEAIDDDGVINRLWVLREPDCLDRLSGLLEPREILIADGHHRYETALSYRDELKQQASSWTGEEAPNFVLTVLVNLRSPGLTILPTHRIVDPLPVETSGKSLDFDTFLQQLSEFFSVEELDGTSTAQFLLGQLKPAHGSPEVCTLGMVTGKRAFLLRLRPESLSHPLLPRDKSPAFRALDVTLLHTFVIEHLLGGKDNGCELTYVKDAGEGVAAVREGKDRMIFLLNPTRLEEVQAVAQAGEKMPQKSTYFYPKLTTGLVMRSLE